MTIEKFRKSNSLVSIVIPTRNRIGLLELAIESATAQTYKNIEVIIHDNCSNDQTASAVKEFCANDARIKYFRSECTRNVVDSFCFAFSKAEGEFVVFLSDDDLLQSNFVEECLSTQGSTGASAVYGGTTIIDVDGVAQVQLNSTDDGKVLGLDETIYCWTKGILPIRSAITCFAVREALLDIGGLPNVGDGHNADNAMMLGLAMRNGVTFTNRTMFCYRVYEGNSGNKFTPGFKARGDNDMIVWLRDEMGRMKKFGRSDIERSIDMVRSLLVRSFRSSFRSMKAIASVGAAVSVFPIALRAYGFRRLFLIFKKET